MEVVAAVICREGRYLLCKRPQAKQHGGLWEFPGGKVAPGESLQDALQRELAEELNVASSTGGSILARISVQTPVPLTLTFLETEITGEPRMLEHEEIGWFEPGAVLALRLAPADEVFAQQCSSLRRTP